ncbi:YidH family protein [Jeotgalibacillus proteolyticus]|uniref:DUF202 domain-containing protein n=1 Tax=Jeotgalibacillus proteolyticus TaxID=2082395 RepID=A0A2S5GAA4_9BACL|nr:DUF202 domain-containing protein [Jeotgalibacillus proteolyticus]PPA69851.1 hypothetical protein C4B60_15075 [Jeotgalibacillus proteolyticus]
MRDNKHVPVQFAQQLLANERTYLAWIRTSAAIAGIGFLVTNLHFVMGDTGDQTLDTFIMIIGIASVFTGILMIVISTVDYFKKNKDIVSGYIRPSSLKIWVLSVSMFLMLSTFLLYFILIN